MPLLPGSSEAQRAALLQPDCYTCKIRTSMLLTRVRDQVTAFAENL